MLVQLSSDMWRKPFWEKYATEIIISAIILFFVLLILIAFSKDISRACALSKERRRKQRYLNMTYAVVAGDTETRVYAGDSYAPPIPEKDGSTFKGWFVDTALTVPWKSTDRVECDLTLYPKWE
jgi:uncharacterized repeat protein (TIGR02543 family)